MKIFIPAIIGVLALGFVAANAVKTETTGADGPMQATLAFLASMSPTTVSGAGDDNFYKHAKDRPVSGRPSWAEN
jgi:hypothetical protein